MQAGSFLDLVLKRDVRNKRRSFDTPALYDHASKQGIQAGCNNYVTSCHEKGLNYVYLITFDKLAH